MPKHDWLAGVMTATVTPFHPDGTLDEAGLRSYVRHLISTSGVTGVLCNGYTGEIDALSHEERRTVVRICAEEINGRGILIAAIDGSSTEVAIQLGLAAKNAGADVIQVNSPFQNLLRRGFLGSPAAAVDFYKTLDREVDLPMSVFQYPQWSGLTYSPETLKELVRIKNVVAIKEAVDLDTYVADHRAIAGQVSLFADHNGYTLLPMLLLGADGSMVGISNVGTTLWVDLFARVTAGDRNAAVELTNTRLLPLMEAFSRDLGRTQTSFVAKVKEALQMLGLIESATVRQPEPLPSAIEREAIRSALLAAGLLT